MDILPILATLRRHKTASGLIVLQVALTCAIVCNALFLISQRLERIAEPSGMADEELVLFNVSGLSKSQDPVAATRADLVTLRGLPGVKSVAIINQLPYGDNFWASGMRLLPDQNAEGVGVANYFAGEGWLQTTGLRLLAGRDFTNDEYQEQSTLDESAVRKIPAVIINQALAKRLFPKGDAVGQTVYVDGPEPLRVVGVLDTLLSPNPGGEGEHERFTMMLPVRPSYSSGVYMVRVDPAQREAVLSAGAAALEKLDARRIVREKRHFIDTRDNYYRQDRNMAWLMGAVCLALLLVTSFGIVGLASFWVQQRTRMIGTRRALGATRGQILRYFQTENFLLTSLGIVLGMSAAYGISLLLMKSYELPRLPWAYLPVGAVLLWALGQIAVLAPARRAAALPPVAALRGN